MIDADECELPAEKLWEGFRYGLKKLWEAQIQFKMHVDGLLYGLAIAIVLSKIGVGLAANCNSTFRPALKDILNIFSH